MSFMAFKSQRTTKGHDRLAACLSGVQGGPGEHVPHI
jgi:hypothetical protein